MTKQVMPIYTGILYESVDAIYQWLVKDDGTVIFQPKGSDTWIPSQYTHEELDDEQVLIGRRRVKAGAIEEVK